MKVNKCDVMNDLTLILLSDWLKGAPWPRRWEKSVVSVVSCRFPNSITTTQQTCCELVTDLLATRQTILTCQDSLPYLYGIKLRRTHFWSIYGNFGKDASFRRSQIFCGVRITVRFRTSLLVTWRYGETGVMDFGLKTIFLTQTTNTFRNPP